MIHPFLNRIGNMKNISASDIRTAYRNQLLELKPNVMVTHNFWGLYGAQAAQNRMRQFYNAIQRKVSGRDWAKQMDRPWPIAFGFREHPDSNPHYHVLVRACPELTAGLLGFGPQLWSLQARHGQLDVQTFAA